MHALALIHLHQNLASSHASYTSYHHAAIFPHDHHHTCMEHFSSEFFAQLPLVPLLSSNMQTHHACHIDSLALIMLFERTLHCMLHIAASCSHHLTHLFHPSPVRTNTHMSSLFVLLATHSSEFGATHSCNTWWLEKHPCRVDAACLYAYA